MRLMFIALAAGAVSATGFAPLGLWPLTLAAFALLIAMLLGAGRLRTAFGLGWWFGTGYFTVGLNWIATAFTFQAKMPHWLGWIAVVLLSMFLALYPAIAGALAWRFGRARPLGFVLLFAAAWIVAEYLRAILFSGFAWNPLAAIATAGIESASMISASSRIIGTYGLSGLFVLIAGVLLLVVSRAGWRNWSAALALPVAATLAGGLTMLGGPASPSERPAVRVIQPNINQNEKWDPELAARNFARLTERTGATGDRPRLIFWPEAAVPDYIEDDPIARIRIAQLLGIEDVLLLGATKLIFEDTPDGRRRVVAARNSFYAMDDTARLLGRYDKAHLVPYGEYLPMRPLLETIGLSRLAPGALDFRPGPGPTTIDLGGFGRVGGQICYEIIFSGQVIDASNRPDFVFNPSNDAWFGAWGPPQHLAQARLRAIEEAMPIVRSTPTGISAVIDAQGQVRDWIPYREAGTIDAALPAAAAPTPFSRLGNWLPILFAALLAGLAFAISRRSR